MSGGGGNVNTTQQVTQTPSANQQSIIDMLMPRVKSQLGQGFQQYQGPTVSGFTPLQEQGQAGAVGAAGGAGTTLGSQGAGALGTLLDPKMLDVASNPNFTNLAGTMTGLANRNLLQNILPSVTSGSTIAGGQYAGGGTRGDLAVGKAIGDTAIGTNAGISQLAEQMYQTGVQGMTSAAGMVPLMQQAQLFAPNVMSQVGGMQQAMTQEQMNAAMSQFYGGQMLPWLSTELGSSFLGSLPGGTTTTTTQGQVPSASPFQQAMGGLAGAGAMAPFLNWMFPSAGGAGGLGSMFGGLGSMFGSIGSGLGSMGSGLMSILPELGMML